MSFLLKLTHSGNRMVWDMQKCRMSSFFWLPSDLELEVDMKKGANKSCKITTPFNIIRNWIFCLLWWVPNVSIFYTHKSLLMISKTSCDRIMIWNLNCPFPMGNWKVNRREKMKSMSVLCWFMKNCITREMGYDVCSSFRSKCSCSLI